MPRLPHRNYLIVGGLVLLVVALVIVGVLSTRDDPTLPAAKPSPTPTPDPVCPLTGEDIPKGVDVERAAIAVKIENSPDARPQSGLEEADVVYEEIVEGGITRFMAIFHCDDSKMAGPVRSARFDDPKIAKPYTRVLAFSGGNSIVERELNRQHMIALQENDGGGSLYRVPPGVLELHNLFGDTAKIRKLPPSKKARGPRTDLFQFGDLPETAKKARRVAIHFTSSNEIEYRWKKGAWQRFEAGAPFQSATDGQISTPNLLIQEVEVNNSPKIVDSAGNPSPDISLMGKGKAVLFRDGKFLKGIWTIEKEGNEAVFTTKDGQPFVFAPGSIWIELVPSKKGSVKGSFSFK
jgi:hypothetical protein